MAEDCARGERLGWEEFVRDYSGITRGLLSHYFPALVPEIEEHVGAVFERARVRMYLSRFRIRLRARSRAAARPADLPGAGPRRDERSADGRATGALAVHARFPGRADRADPDARRRD